MRKIDLLPNKYSNKKILSNEQEKENSFENSILKAAKITPIIPNQMKEGTPHPKKMNKSSSTGKLPMVGTTKANKKQNYWGIPINININNNIYNNINYIGYPKEATPGNLFKNRAKSIKNQLKQSASANDISAENIGNYSANSNISPASNNISTVNKRINLSKTSNKNINGYSNSFYLYHRDPIKLKKTKTVEDESAECSLVANPIIFPNTGKNSATDNKNKNFPNILGNANENANNNLENNNMINNMANTTKDFNQGNSNGYFGNSLQNLQKFEALIKKGNKLKVNKNPKSIYNLQNNSNNNNGTIGHINQIFPKQPIPPLRNQANFSGSPNKDGEQNINLAGEISPFDVENNLNNMNKEHNPNSEIFPSSTPYKKQKEKENNQKYIIKKSHLRKTSEIIECGSYRDKVLNNGQKDNPKIPKVPELVKLYSYNTKAGKNEEGKTKTNQDSYLINFKINNIDNFHMFGILDGHGAIGHFASRTSTNFIKNYINNDKILKKLKNTDEIYKQLKADKYSYIISLFRKAELELLLAEKDFSFSGTTCVIVFLVGKKIICANAGDSRAIMISKTQEFYTVKALSRDHKPDLELERKRIESKGGSIGRYIIEGEEVGPVRVWVKGEGYPGLAMSRSIGDLVASQVGVIPDPEILEYDIEDDSKFLVLATDGIWDYLPNTKVMELGQDYYEKGDCENYCQTLVKEATQQWEENEYVRDDITCISVFF